MATLDSVVFTWFRTRAQLIGVALLLSLGTFGGSLLLPHADDCHEYGCLPQSVEHDASAHRFQGAPTPDQAHTLHCLVCHWARSVRPRTDVAFVAAPAAESRPRIHVESFTAARPSLAAQPPLRSPPSSFSS